MKIVNYDGRATLVMGGHGLDVEQASAGRFGSDVQEMYRRWDELREWAAQSSAQLAAMAGFELDEERLGAPSPRPAQVIAIGLNYADHAAEGGFALPETPAVFTKFPTSITGPYGDIVLPDGKVDWEVELVAVIGREADNVPVSAAWSHVAGLTVGQDISERITQHRPPAPQFSLGKSFPGFGPMGPALVTPDEFEDPDDIALSSSVNGEQVQNSRTGQLIFSVPEIVSYVSGIMRLLPGDVIFTGTPAGVGKGRTPPRYLTSGDVLESTVEHIGTMRHRFVSPVGRTETAQATALA